MRLRAVVPSLVAAVGLALAVALVVPAGTAQAMEGSQSVIESVSPGTATTPGTPIVPESVLTTTSDVPGTINDQLPGMLWYGGSASNSILNSGYENLTDGNVASPTNTGVGYSVGLAYCSRTFQMDAVGWGTGMPLHVSTVTLNKGIDQATCATSAMRELPQLTCYNVDTGAFVTFGDSSHGNSGQAGPFVNVCAVNTATNSTSWVPVAYSVVPTPKNGAVAIGTDGGYWTNSTYDQAFGQNLIISIQKTCKAVDGTTQTVSAHGAPGTGVIPALSCPVGTYTVGQKIWSHLPDGSATHVISQTGLVSTAPGAYPDCIGDALVCDLSVWIDGVRCALLLQGCDKWNDPASVDPSKVQCKWGNYVMPASDCAPLTNCYGVPIDSISNPTAGDPTQCGIDPDEPLTNGPLKPIKGGQIQQPDDSQPSAGPTGPTGPPGADGSDAPTVQPTIIVTVNPTINVNVPQPTVNVTVINNGPGDSTIPQGRDGSDCWPTGTAKYNPLDWAYTPMHCALSKMFMPTPGKAEALLNGIGQDQPFKAWTDALSGMAGAFSSTAGGCQGPAVSLGEPLNMTIYPASACNEPQATLAHISRAGTGAVLIIGGLWSAIAAILQGIGYSVRPGGGDE